MKREKKPVDHPLWQTWDEMQGTRVCHTEQCCSLDLFNLLV
jgi:hypothetical protein